MHVSITHVHKLCKLFKLHVNPLPICYTYKPHIDVKKTPLLIYAMRVPNYENTFNRSFADWQYSCRMYVIQCCFLFLFPVICQCHHGGTCHVSENGRQECTCPAWYLGSRCENDGRRKVKQTPHRNHILSETKDTSALLFGVFFSMTICPIQYMNTFRHNRYMGVCSLYVYEQGNMIGGWVNQAYSRLSTTHGHTTDCKLELR